MIHEIRIPDNYYLRNIIFFESAHLDKLPNIQVVPLFGPNGVGKTTLLSAIAETMRYRARELTPTAKLTALFADVAEADYNIIVDKALIKSGCLLNLDDVPHRCLSYMNGTDNLRRRSPRSLNESFNPYYLNARMDAQAISEGQSIIYSAMDLFDIMKPGKETVTVENGHLIVLIDELDSGLSLDNLDMFMRKIKNIIRKREDIQIIFSFNNPRVLKYFPHVLSMYDGSVLELHNEEDMLSEMRKNKKMFDKARKRSDGRPKIFD